MKIKFMRISAMLMVISLMLSSCSFAVVENDSVKIGWNSAALAEETEATPAPTLKPIQFRHHDKGDDTRVRRMQEQLVALDYYSDKVDGRFGWFTMLALQDFQKDNGLKDTGILDAETEAILYSEDVRPKDIRLNSKDDEADTRVRKLQERLIELDYLKIEADGAFGKSTETALKYFQKCHELQESGILNAETEAILYSEAAQAKLLGLNDQDDETDTRVSKLQNRLVELDYLKVEADGVFGKSTEDALKKFQATNGLTESGMLDAETEALVYSENAMAKLLGLNDQDDETDTRVSKLQNRLIELDYLKVEADGVFGESTEEALKKFQAINGLSESGEMDAATEAMVYSENAMAKLLGLNDQDDETDTRVSVLQQRLIDLNYLRVEADGVFGKSTEDALKEFQAANGLSETGEMDAATEALVYSEDALHKFLAKNSRDWGEQTKVQQLQERLIDLDYLDSTADGAFGQSTEDALLYFQQVNGLSESGVLDIETEAAIYSEAAIPEPTPTPGPCQNGSTGYQVELIQEKMRLYGFATDPVDGKYGNETTEIVKGFQEYAVTHYGDKFDEPQPENTGSLQMFILETTPSSTPAPEMMVSSDGGTPAPVETPAPEPTPTPDYDIDGNTSVDLYYYLRDDRFPIYRADAAPGDEGDETLRLQNRLAVLEYYYQDPDGIYSDLTEEAVKYFQSRNGLEETGIADKATQEILFSDKAVIAETAEFPYYIKVSIDDQRVYIYRWRDGGYNQLVRTMICSTGLGTTTPKGIFQSGGQRDGRWHYFTEFKCWAQYAYKIKGNILFHSVIYSRANENSLRQSSVRNLGHKASHGCVRLMPNDAKFIYLNCPKGTTIEIY